MTAVYDNIYLGDSADANNRDGCLDKCGITAILNCAFDLDRPHYGRIQAICGLIDGEGNEYIAFHNAVEMLRHLLNQDHKVLVHCHEGKSRSASVIVAYLAYYENVPFQEAMETLIRLRPLVNPCKPLRELAKKYVGV